LKGKWEKKGKGRKGKEKKGEGKNAKEKRWGAINQLLILQKGRSERQKLSGYFFI